MSLERFQAVVIRLVDSKPVTLIQALNLIELATFRGEILLSDGIKSAALSIDLGQVRGSRRHERVMRKWSAGNERNS